MFKLCIVYIRIYTLHACIYVYSAYTYRIHIKTFQLPWHRRNPSGGGPGGGGDASSVAATWWLCKRRETRDRSRVMWEAGDWKMPNLWMSKFNRWTDSLLLSYYIIIIIMFTFQNLTLQRNGTSQKDICNKWQYPTMAHVPCIMSASSGGSFNSDARNATGRQGTDGHGSPSDAKSTP